MKAYNVMHNVGKVKYLVNYHDNVKTHKDGSPFFDIACFSNKVILKTFIDGLIEKGYQYGDSKLAEKKEEITNSDVNTIIAACLLAATRYDREDLKKKFPLESDRYRNIENKLRQLCYIENKRLVAML